MLNNGGTWNFYNGLIKGTVKKGYGYDEPTNVREGYNIAYEKVTSDDTTYGTAYLKFDSTGPWLPDGTYTAGQEVTFGGEQFFVIADDGDSVRLLAKYCLSNSSDEKQRTPGDGSQASMSFSNNNFWSSDFTSSPFDLQGKYLANNPLSSDETTANNAILKAQAYAQAKGAVSGRLMTREECFAMANGSDTMKQILYYCRADASSPLLAYDSSWIGSATSASEVWHVSAADEGVSSSLYSNAWYSCRPVLEVAKITPSTDKTSPQLPAGTYTVGQEVTFGDEQFFVVADDGDSVRLLAKYCLSPYENTQTAKDETNYSIHFASTNYWSSDFTSAPFDLQSEEMLTKLSGLSTEYAGNNAIIKAQEYGASKGVIGRLMTKTEADAMINSNSALMYGHWTDGSQPNTARGYYWWLGSAVYAAGRCLWAVCGTDSIDYITNDTPTWNFPGVRPILVVPET